MRAVVVVIVLLWTVSVAEAGGVVIPELVKYTDGTVTLLVPKGWSVTVDGSHVEVVPPADAVQKNGLVALTLTVEPVIDSVAKDIELYVSEPMRWSKLKGGWVCAAGADAFDPEMAGVVCGRKLDETHWLNVHAFGKASKASLSRLARRVSLSADGFSPP